MTSSNNGQAGNHSKICYDIPCFANSEFWEKVVFMHTF